MHALRADVAFDGERFLPDGATVLVQDGAILAVEPARVDPPADCPLTTYPGTLLPGLVDGHVHLVADATMGGLERAATYDEAALDEVVATSLARPAAAGVTTVVDLGDRDFVTLRHRDRPAPGAPRILAAGPPLTVPEGHCFFLGGAVSGADAVRRAVADRAERGVDVVKVMASGGMATAGSDVLGVQFGDEELRLLVACAHEAGLRVLAHAHSLAGAWHAVRAGVDGIEHFSCLTEVGPRYDDELLDAVADAGIVLDLTMGIDERLMAGIGPPPPAVRMLLERTGLTFEAIQQRRIAALGRFRSRGVTLMNGTDAGMVPPKPHGGAWRAVAGLAEGGYPVAEALATATSGAADAFGLGSVTGRLSPGLAADLLVVDGDLRADADALGRPAAVLVRGTPVPDR